MFLVEIATLCLKDRFLKMFTSQTTVSYCFHCTKMKFSITDFFSKCDQIRSFLRIWLHLLKKSITENFIFCAVFFAHCWSGCLFLWYSCNIIVNVIWQNYFLTSMGDYVTASYFQTLTYLRNKYFYPCKLISHEKMCKMCIHT